MVCRLQGKRSVFRIKLRRKDTHCSPSTLNNLLQESGTLYRSRCRIDRTNSLFKFCTLTHSSVTMPNAISFNRALLIIINTRPSSFFLIRINHTYEAQSGAVSSFTLSVRDIMFLDIIKPLYFDTLVTSEGRNCFSIDWHKNGRWVSSRKGRYLSNLTYHIA